MYNIWNFVRMWINEPQSYPDKSWFNLYKLGKYNKVGRGHDYYLFHILFVYWLPVYHLMIYDSWKKAQIFWLSQLNKRGNPLRRNLMRLPFFFLLLVSVFEYKSLNLILKFFYDNCRCRIGYIWTAKMLKQTNSKNALINLRPLVIRFFSGSYLFILFSSCIWMNN